MEFYVCSKRSDMELFEIITEIAKRGNGPFNDCLKIISKVKRLYQD